MKIRLEFSRTAEADPRMSYHANLSEIPFTDSKPINSLRASNPSQAPCATPVQNRFVANYII